jgi:hypothetical protein
LQKYLNELIRQPFRRHVGERIQMQGNVRR